MTRHKSDALIFFGATGNLARKQIFPALQALIRRGSFDVPIVGVARSPMDIDGFRALARQSLEEHGGLDEAAYAKLASRLRYVSGDYNEPGTFKRIKEAMGEASRPLFYLAIPPDAFATVVKGLAGWGCHQDARVVVEKPFGRDLASARALNQSLEECFPEIVDLPDRPLSRQGTGPEPAVLPLRERVPRTDLEPAVRAQRSDHDGGDVRGGRARPLLRGASARFATSCRTTCSSWSRC